MRWTDKKDRLKEKLSDLSTKHNGIKKIKRNFAWVPEKFGSEWVWLEDYYLLCWWHRYFGGWISEGVLCSELEYKQCKGALIIKKYRKFEGKVIEETELIPNPEPYKQL